jgi:hypothetical protein
MSDNKDDEERRSERVRAILLLRHLLDHGLDTISYLPDAVDNTRVSSVVTEYTRFSVDSATIQARLIVTKFDKYDKTNDMEACEFLLNSLERTLAADLRMDLREGDNFPILYLRMIKLIRTTSIQKARLGQSNGGAEECAMPLRHSGPIGGKPWKTTDTSCSTIWI